MREQGAASLGPRRARCFLKEEGVKGKILPVAADIVTKGKVSADDVYAGSRQGQGARIPRLEVNARRLAAGIQVGPSAFERGRIVVAANATTQRSCSRSLDEQRA